MTLRQLVFFSLPILAVVIEPMAAHAASATFFGPIFPPECRCEGGAPSYGCILSTVQNAINFGISLGVAIAGIMFAYTGLMWIIHSSNPEERSKARGMLLNIFIGLAILLSAWLVVDFIMKRLYNADSTTYGPWNSILAASPADICIESSKPKKIDGIGGHWAIGELGGSGSQLTTGPAGTAGVPDGTFEYQTDAIKPQGAAASAKLASLLSCMAGKVPANVGKISSISEIAIASGQKTMAQCAKGGCEHAAGSCHYGGKSCIGQSYAVDFGDDQNSATLTNAARACNADFIYYEGNHLHVSVGKACGCN